MPEGFKEYHAGHKGRQQNDNILYRYARIPLQDEIREYHHRRLVEDVYGEGRLVQIIQQLAAPIQIFLRKGHHRKQRAYAIKVARQSQQDRLPRKIARSGGHAFQVFKQWEGQEKHPEKPPSAAVHSLPGIFIGRDEKADSIVQAVKEGVFAANIGQGLGYCQWDNQEQQEPCLAEQPPKPADTLFPPLIYYANEKRQKRARDDKKVQDKP